MIDDNFNDPVTAYLKGKAIQEKTTPIPDRIRDPNVCSYCHSSTVHTITHSCAQMERPLTRQDVLDIGAWFNDEKRMNIGRDVQGKALSLVGDNLRLRDELDHSLKGKAMQEKNAPKEKEESSMAINERFEIMAELFHAATGLLAPGKSAPPGLQTEQYGIARQRAWEEWSDTKALNMALKFIQALRHNEAEHDRLYDALINSDTNQLRQERDALRLRIKAVDEEHVQLAEERKKMIDAYTKVEEQKNFWESEHKALMETCHVMRNKLDAMTEEHRDERLKMFKDLQQAEIQRDQYKKLWTIRGKALARPCLSCGYTGNQIRMQNGEIP